MQKRASSLFLFWFFHNASNFSVSAPFPLQFSLNYNVSIEIQGLSSPDCSFQGLSRCVRTLYQSNIFEKTPSQFLIKKRTSLMKPYQFYLQIDKKVRPYLHSLLCRRFLRARECFCSPKRKVETPKREGVLSHKIQEDEYSETNINKQLLPAQNTPTVYMEGGSTLKGLTGDPRVFSVALQRFSFASVN